MFELTTNNSESISKFNGSKTKVKSFQTQLPWWQQNQETKCLQVIIKPIILDISNPKQILLNPIIL